jgi:predicted tellurium resistance membrane protein TerC
MPWASAATVADFVQCKARILSSFFLIIMQIAVLVMMLVSGSVSRFVDTHPTVKVLALAFLVLACVEMVNIRLRKLRDRHRKHSG